MACRRLAAGGRPPTPWGQFVYAVAVTPDGDHVISGGLDGAIATWDVHRTAPQPRGRREFKGQYRRITSLSLTPDGRTLASASEDGTIALWHVDSGQLRDAPFKAGSDAVSSVSFTPNGRMLASAGGDGRVVLRNLDPADLVTRACQIANHDLLETDWRVYLGRDRYHATCSNRKSP